MCFPRSSPEELRLDINVRCMVELYRAGRERGSIGITNAAPSNGVKRRIRKARS
jgi:hypothetical protein